MQRRHFVGNLLAGSALLTAGQAFGYEISKSDADWKKQLSPAAYDVLRHQGTEAPFTSPLNEETSRSIVCRIRQASAEMRSRSTRARLWT